MSDFRTSLKDCNTGSPYLENKKNLLGPRISEKNRLQKRSWSNAHKGCLESKDNKGRIEVQ